MAHMGLRFRVCNPNCLKLHGLHQLVRVSQCSAGFQSCLDILTYRTSNLNTSMHSSLGIVAVVLVLGPGSGDVAAAAVEAVVVVLLVW